ncbi:MAG: M28 family peptidase [Acidobacteria bacterium]|nr:M28 family peptidase [Acidobacteriota bacterium]
MIQQYPWHRQLAFFRRRLSAVALVLLISSAQVPGFNGSLPSIPAGAVASIRPDLLKKHLEFLASDELGGRYTLSNGNKIAARYLAAQLESFGYRGAAAPAGRSESAFFQKIEFSLTSLNAAESSLVLSSRERSATLRSGEGFRTLQAIDSEVAGELVFAGFGVVTADQRWNDYKGLDVKGKIVVTLQGFPPDLPSKRAALREFGAIPAAERGALAVLVLPGRQTSESWANSVGRREFERIEMVRGGHVGPRLPIPVLTLSPAAAAVLLAESGVTLGELHAPESGKAVPSLALKSVTATLRLETAVRQMESQNVVGILEGSDPLLKDEYVALSAHFDHLESRDGVVFNGADDNASGTGAILEMARALSMVRPRRSILVVLHTGEEMGLLGSRFFTDIEPLVPLKNIVADLNIDMIGRSRKSGDTKSDNAHLTDAQTVYVIGSGRISAQLREVNEQTAAELGQLTLDYTYEEEDLQNYYSRSDHYHYAKHGIPIAFFFTGEHEDYHKATDDVEKIDFQKLTLITRMIYATAWRVANLDERLKIDKAA